MAGPFKLKGFSGFGNSPMKKEKDKSKKKFKGGDKYDPSKDYQKAANQYYLKTGNISGPGTGNDPKDATSDALYHHMVRQSDEK